MAEQPKSPRRCDACKSQAPADAGRPSCACADAPLPFCTQLIRSTDDAIIIQDIEGRIEWLNPATEAMFGVTLDEVRGQKVLARLRPKGAGVTPAKADAFRYDINSTIFTRDHLARHCRANGDTFWNRHSFTLLHTAEGVKVAVICRDVTHEVETERRLRQTQKELEHAAHHDALTGLANRKWLNHYFETDRVRKSLADGEMGVLQLDLDKFKEINDTLGHAAGDASLAHVAEALKKVCGPNDLACRTGGDEFILTYHGVRTADALLTRAELLMQVAGESLIWNSQSIRIGLSIGACLASDAQQTGDTLIRQADQALYAAKSHGRGRVVLYTPQIGKVQIAQNQLAREVRLAVANRELSVHLQPQLDLATGHITGCETLLRWNHPRLGQLRPAKFLETARRAGVLADFDYHAMHLSLDALKDLHRAGFDGLAVSLNVSAEILADANYPGLLDWALQSRGLKPSDICVEITETTILQGGNHTVTAAVERLKRMGTRVALDDFGTGYAGLAHISSIEVDEIKLDGSLIARLDQDPRNRAIVKSIIDLCRKLNTRVVAEGVETDDQLRLLQQARCTAAQGYVLAYPQCVEDMIEWLTQTQRGAGDTATRDAAPGVAIARRRS